MDKAHFTIERRLEFGDCDFSGTAYYPAYMNMLNGVNDAFFAHLGYPWPRIMGEERWGTPTVHLTCDFAAPSFFGDVLTFSIRVAKAGRTSVTLDHHIGCKGETRWTCRQVLVASDLTRHGSRPWPDALKERFDAFASDGGAKR